MAAAEPAARRVNLPVIALGAVIAVIGFGASLVLARSGAPVVGSSADTAIVVAARNLDMRTTLQAGDLTVAHWTPGDIPPGALARPESAIGQVLQASLKQGQPVLSNQIGTGQQSAFLPLTKGLVAATIPSAELVGVGGYIQAGDYIDVIAVVSPRGGGPANVRTVYGALRVIKAGPSGAGAGGGTTTSLTVAVSQCQAEFLNWFIANAALKYTLLAHDDYPATQTAVDGECPASGSVKGVTEADVKARWPGLL